MTWHVDTALLDEYASEALSPAGMASVELHVTSCASCRSLVAARADTSAQARVKRALDDRLDAPPTTRVERMLSAVGVGEADARVMGSALALHGSWLAGSLLTLAFVVLATTVGEARVGLALFLVAAPLVPLAGVALAYGPWVDPTFEIATSSPMPGSRIVLLRAVAVTAPAVPAIAALSVLLPFGPLDFAWLLPALGLAAATLALGTVTALPRAAAALGTLWLVAAGLGLARAPRSSAEAFVRGFAAFRPSGQLLFVMVVAASLAAMALRRPDFETAR